MPVFIRLPEVAKLINKSTPELLYEDKDINLGANVFMDIKVKRNGLITLQTVAGKVNTNIPLEIEVLAHWKMKMCAFCPDLSQSKAFSIKLHLQTSSRIDISKGWILKSTTSSSFTMEQPPCIKIVGVPVCFENATRKSIQQYLPQINELLDKMIVETVDIASQIKYWTAALQKPYLITETPLKTWGAIRLTKSAVSAPVSVSNSLLAYYLTVEGVFKLALGDEPSYTDNFVLPPLSITDQALNTFQLNVPLQISLSHLQNYLQQELTNQPLQLPDSKRAIHIHKLEISSVNNNLVLAIDFTSKRLKGKLYLQAEPFFSDEDQQLSFKNVRFDINTNRALLDKAAWLSNPAILKMLENKLQFDLHPYLTKFRNDITMFLQNYKMADNVIFNMQVNEIIVKQLLLKQEQLTLFLMCNGVSEINVK